MDRRVVTPEEEEGVTRRVKTAAEEAILVYNRRKTDKLMEWVRPLAIPLIVSLIFGCFMVWKDVEELKLRITSHEQQSAKIEAALHELVTEHAVLDVKLSKLEETSRGKR